MMPTYLITQATGQQSRQVISQLLPTGAKIHAVVRDLQKALPAILYSPNITLFQGESKNHSDILAAAQGCTGAFLNTIPYPPGLEVQQARAVISACKEAGVETLVAATTHGTWNRAFWDTDDIKEIGLHPYFSSKAEVEHMVRTAGFKAYTIVRPAVIHHDFFLPGSKENFPRLATHGVFDHLFTEGASIPFTDAQDVGKYAAAALQDPEKFGGEGIDLGNEMITAKDIHDILLRVSGREVPTIAHTLQEAQEKGVFVFGQLFHLWANFKDMSYTTAAAKETQAKFGIPFTSLEEALQRDKALLMAGLPNV